MSLTLSQKKLFVNFYNMKNLECEICTDIWKEDDDVETNIESLKECGRCIACLEEYGEMGWADR